MPSLNVPIQPLGPLVQVYIGVSQPRHHALLAAALPTPTPVAGMFLIDTGASATCVDPDLIRSLGLQPTGQVLMSTPSTQGSPHACDQFDVGIFIPGGTMQGGGYAIPAIPILTTHLKSQGIDGLLGRDIIGQCIMIYNGPAGFCTLAY